MQTAEEFWLQSSEGRFWQMANSTWQSSISNPGIGIHSSGFTLKTQYSCLRVEARSGNGQGQWKQAINLNALSCPCSFAHSASGMTSYSSRPSPHTCAEVLATLSPSKRNTASRNRAIAMEIPSNTVPFRSRSRAMTSRASFRTNYGSLVTMPHPPIMTSFSYPLGLVFVVLNFFFSNSIPSMRVILNPFFRTMVLFFHDNFHVPCRRQTDQQLALKRICLTNCWHNGSG